jgi:NAD(P)-dependent dehydrogenase (short-subunit alcohol dehydrogenase family)
MPQVFFLTGSSRGLGRQIAEAVLAAGHQLVATARQPGQLADLADRYGRQILPVALDVTDAEAAAAAVAAGIETFGRLDVVVNNAGYANLAAVEDITLADFRAQVEANLFGVVNVTKAALPVLRAQGGGHIIQVSSIGGRLATAGPRGRPARRQGHRPGAGRHADRLGRVIHAGAAGQRAVPADRRRGGPGAP